MIIDINQTHANSEQLFDVFYDNSPKYSGKLGRYTPLETFSLRNRAQKINLTGAFALPIPIDMVPLTYLFGRPKVVKNCYCQNGIWRLGTIGCVEEGIGKAHYHIADADNRKYDAYHFAEYQGCEYLCIYFEDRVHAATVVTSLTVKDSCYRYRLYLLDEYKDSADMLAMFVMYFANWYNTKRFRARSGTYTVRKKPSTNYTDKFDPEWHTLNFKTEREEAEAR